MTNKDKYKKAFSAIQTSSISHLEVEKMKNNYKKSKFNRKIALIVACLMILGSTTIAYAANVGGIQRIIQLWIQGDLTEVTIDFDDKGSYSMKYVDEKGQVKQQNGGGVSFDENGKTVPLSEQEVIEHLNAPDVLYKEDGTVCVYWLGKTVDITDKFENNICYVKLLDGDDVLYMTIRYQKGYSTSPNKYLDPPTLN